MYTTRAIDANAEEALRAHSPLLRRLLIVRGITTEEEAETFLHPDWSRDVHDPFLMKDMQRSVERIISAMDKHETIALWSDYDMDGIPGAALLYDCFAALEYPHVVHYTPHRNRDGFGLNKKGIDELHGQGVSLIITIDCGIGDVDLVTYANTQGLDVIITDHHLPHETLPPAWSIVNPKQKDCAYPEPMLCGAGVAFKLVQALLQYLGRTETPRPLPKEGWEKWLVDLAGMSTVADMVPLRGENRALAHYGLVVLRKTRRPGIQALLRKARVSQRFLTEEDIGFTIAPRVNAASRMGHAKDAFTLLTTKDEAEAATLAEELDHINTQRKTLVATMKREIKRRLAEVGEPQEVIVLGNPDWKPSLLGLVAGGLAEDYGRPVFLWGREEGVTIKGSCRSEGSTNVFHVMHEARDVFLEYGGHAHSGGFSVAEEHIHTLEQALIEAHQSLKKVGPPEERFVDAELSLSEVQHSTYRDVRKLAPFGEGNPKPLFLIRNVTVDSVRLFGKGKGHVEVKVRDDVGTVVKGIAFFSKPETFHQPPTEGATVSIVAHLEQSHFGGKHELRLRLVDVV